jgi:DUF917 family protein
MTQAKSEVMVERAFRAALSQMGSHVGCAKGPVTGKNTKSWVVEHTISLSWRIGRAVALSRSLNQIDTVAESIISEVGGDKSAKVLFKGKIVGVERTLRVGHVYGEVIIQAMNVTGSEGPDGKGRYKIPFKNENILAIREEEDGTETVRLLPCLGKVQANSIKVLASVPDLICVIDAQNGEAIGTPEYRYGLLVIVLGIVASEKWTSTPRGLEIGGPKGFGMDNVEYKALGKFQKPRSVIDEYGV